jgi:hypothetical protein
MSWTGHEAEAGYRKLEGGLNWVRKDGKAGKRNLEREKRKEGKEIEKSSERAGRHRCCTA